MITIVLYSALKKLLQGIDKQMVISYNYIDYEQPNTMSINVRSYSDEYQLYNGANQPASLDEANLENAPYAGKVSRVQIILQQERKDTDDGGMFDLLKKGQMVKYTLQKLYNKVITTEDKYVIDNIHTEDIAVEEITGTGIDILIKNTDAIGGPIQLESRAPEGKILVSLNCTISYSLLGNHTQEPDPDNNTGDNDDNSSIINNNTETADTEQAGNSEDQSGTE
jgi:hypothetical protein